MTREPKIAYVLLRNAHFGPRLAASVELCVRDLLVHSRMRARRSSFARRWMGLSRASRSRRFPIQASAAISAKPGASRGFSGAGASTLRSSKITCRRPRSSRWPRGARVILHTHAYVKAPSSALDGAVRGQELRRLSGFAFVSEYALNRFRGDFPHLRAVQRAVPNGLDMRAWSAAKPKARSILCVGRALKGKGHLEAMAAIVRALPSRPEWTARFMVSDPVAADREPETVQALRDAARAFNGRIQVDFERALCRGQGGLGKRRGRHGADDWPRAVRPHGAGGARQRRRAHHLGAGRPGRDLRPVRGHCRSGEADGLAAALGQLMDEPERRADLARAGRKRDQQLFDIRRWRARWTISSRLASELGAEKRMCLAPDGQVVVP